MHRTLSRSAWIVFLVLFFSTSSFPQEVRTATSQVAKEESCPSPSPTPTPSPSPTPTPTQILYTGRLLGYFRVPSLQSGDKLKYPVCPATSSETDSDAATIFLKRRSEHPNAILVGTGDNFAPQLEARVFFPAPGDPQEGKYHARNKELYYGDGNAWVPYSTKLREELKEEIAKGLGTIPNDNVGCFLAAAEYAAVVPGKHDFYFGVERIRQLARFMAGLPTYAGKSAPQMLGANLVVNSVPLDPGDPQESKGKPEWLVAWAKDYPYPILNLPGSVYPWLSYVRIKIKDVEETRKLLSGVRVSLANGSNQADFLKLLDAHIDQTKTDLGTKTLDEKSRVAKETNLRVTQEVRAAVSQFTIEPFYLCKSENSPNEIAKAGSGCGDPLKEGKVRLLSNTLVYEIPLDLTVVAESQHKTEYPMSLERGKNYGFCRFKSNNVIPCHLFSVYSPFFFYPHQVPSTPTNDNSAPRKFTDPAPFAFVAKDPEHGRNQDVIIFGVVEPDLAQHVGVLNLAWQNRNDKFKTSVSIEDPAQALEEQVEYFERWYKDKHPKKEPFNGLKILLAQMSPQRARLFSARVTGFQVVVSAANKEQATSQLEQTLKWTSENRASGFVAVPAPYYDTQQQQGFVNPGMIEATLDKDSWNLKSAKSASCPVEEKKPETARKHLKDYPAKLKMSDFSNYVKTALEHCLPNGFPITENLADQLKLLTLCAMQKRTNADVILLQKRDFFDLPETDPEEPIEVQLYLDRLIWKGDLLNLMFVPGRAIKDAFKRSQAFETEETSILTLVDERGRSFEQLGIRRDTAHAEYLINEVAIVDTKMYTVATSDFIGAGDTGYPQLAGAALNPHTHPREFPAELDPISGLVCRQLFSKDDDKDTFCLRPLNRDLYLDESVAMPVPTYQQPSFGTRFLKLLPFGKPRNPPPPKDSATALQREVEGRPIWTFSLRNLSFAVTSLTSNLSDDEISQKFGGIPASGIEAQRNRDLVFGLDTRITRSAHRHDYFLASGIDYHETISGDSPLNQVANLFTFDAGIIWRWPGRSIPHWAPVFSVHTETQLRQPVKTFGLGTNDSLRVNQDRTWLFLPRLGLRWQNRGSALEVGAQVGRAINALAGYRFETGGVITECLLDSARTLAACIAANSTAPNINITKDSVATPILHNRPRAGFYWNGSFAIQFHEKVRYEFEDKGDFFFNFGGDNVTDTRFRDLSKHRLSFSIFPSVSIGPALHLLLYQNKINNDFLAQRTLLVETKISFELFNRREKKVQLKNKP